MTGPAGRWTSVSTHYSQRGPEGTWIPVQRLLPPSPLPVPLEMRRWARQSLRPIPPQVFHDSELRTSSSPGSNATQNQTSNGRPPFCENPGTSLPGVIMQRRLSFTVDISSFLWGSEAPPSRICITWEPVSNADSLAPPRPPEETLRVEPGSFCFTKSSWSCRCALRF